MNEELTPSNQSEYTRDESLCVNCNTNPFKEGHAINLCEHCRTSLIKYPIPKWIRMFALGILAVIIISLVRTQIYVAAAVHLGKAEKAIENKRFATAQREIEMVLKQFPNDLTSNANMVIASAYNIDINASSKAYLKIENKIIEDEELLARLNSSMDYLNKNYPQDTLTMQKIAIASTNKEQLMKLYEYVDSTSTGGADLILKVHVANYLYDLKEYKSAEMIIQNVLRTNPGFYSAIGLASAIKRNTGQYNKAIEYCNLLLSINHEDVYAISQKAKIELKRKRDNEAAKYVKEALNINANNDAVLEAKALVDYFAGRKKESLTALETIKRHESLNGDQTISSRLTPIINGLEVYR